MNHGSLFSGIGGFDLAAEWIGWNNLFHCEWNPFGQKVLKYYWPQAESFNDITQTDFKKYANRIDILTGGFPCQPYSSAGKRKGKDDERHLWPEMLRAISEIRPRWVVGENVLGLVNWSGGLVFHEVQADLEAQGYEVQPFLLPAAGVGSPHRRDRIWFIAYANNARTKQSMQFNAKRKENNKQRRKQSQFEYRQNGFDGITTNTDGTEQGNNFGENITEEKKIRRGKKSNVLGKLCSDGNFTNSNSTPTKYKIQTRRNLFTSKNEPTNWRNFPTQPPICSGDDGLPTELDGITFPKWRNESIKGYGNAVVPQVVYQIFKAIQEYELQKM